MTTQTDRNLTLADVATLAGATKRTAQRWLEKATKAHGELGELVEGTRLFSDAEKETLLSYQSKRSPNTVATEEPVQSQSIAAELQIYEGNHQVTLPTPNLDDSFNLGVLRSDADVLSYDDPLTLAQSVITQNQQIMGAMDAHHQQQMQKLAATNKALQVIHQSNQQLQDAAIEYKIDSRIQGAQLNQATQQLGAEITEQQRLGKSAVPNASATES